MILLYTVCYFKVAISPTRHPHPYTNKNNTLRLLASASRFGNRGDPPGPVHPIHGGRRRTNRRKEHGCMYPACICCRRTEIAELILLEYEQRAEDERRVPAKDGNGCGGLLAGV